MPLIREFIYADMDRVRSILAQIYGGVPEEGRSTESTGRTVSVGVKDYFKFAKDGGQEEYVQRSLVDAIFPELEATLEAEGLLTDISDILNNEESDQEVENLVSPGSIVRITADAQLFDVEYVATTLAGASIIADSAADLANSAQPNTRKSPANRKPHQRAEKTQLEDLVENFDPNTFGVTPNMLRAFIRVSRGMFNTGLHLIMTGRNTQRWSMTARLQKGRRYLDSEPDVLFSRYGIAPQEWTIVGTIGQFSTPFNPGQLKPQNLVEANGTVSRKRFVDVMSSIMAYLAGHGFADIPPYPGFSVVPMAVYRPIPESVDWNNQ